MLEKLSLACNVCILRCQHGGTTVLQAQATKSSLQADDLLDSAILSNHQSELTTRFRIDSFPENFCVELICGVIYDSQ